MEQTTFTPDEPLRVSKHRSKDAIKLVEARKEYAVYVDDWITYRFVKEVERIEREGRVINRLDLCAKISVTRDTINQMRQAGREGAPRRIARASVIYLLKLEYNADVQFILQGVEDPERSLPYKVDGSGRKIRIDQYEKRIYEYSAPAVWAIGPRRPGDDEQRFEKGYYITPSFQYWLENIRGKSREELVEEE